MTVTSPPTQIGRGRKRKKRTRNKSKQLLAKHNEEHSPKTQTKRKRPKTNRIQIAPWERNQTRANGEEQPRANREVQRKTKWPTTKNERGTTWSKTAQNQTTKPNGENRVNKQRTAQNHQQTASHKCKTQVPTWPPKAKRTTVHRSSSATTAATTSLADKLFRATSGEEGSPRRTPNRSSSEETEEDIRAYSSPAAVASTLRSGGGINSRSNTRGMESSRVDPSAAAEVSSPGGATVATNAAEGCPQQDHRRADHGIAPSGLRTRDSRAGPKKCTTSSRGTPVEQQRLEQEQAAHGRSKVCLQSEGSQLATGPSSWQAVGGATSTSTGGRRQAEACTVAKHCIRWQINVHRRVLDVTRVGQQTPASKQGSETRNSQQGLFLDANALTPSATTRENSESRVTSTSKKLMVRRARTEVSEASKQQRIGTTAHATSR